MSTKPIPSANSLFFGDDFELDLRAFQLRSAGVPLKLKPIQMELLRFLVERRGELVTREEIVERIWGKGVFLDTDNSINGAISRIRQVLRDDAEQPRFVQTVTGRGYRFIATVMEGHPEEQKTEAADTVAGAENLAGKKVAHYRILQLLGGGGMGVVYMAEDLKLGRKVAVKFLPSELAGDPVAFERLQQEARAASSLDHRNICSVYELGEFEGQPFIAMQLLEGKTLREWIGAASQSPSRERIKGVFDLAVQVADGLDAAHQKGIIHRDIKPANIFVTDRGEAKILDFGVAKFVGASDSSGTNAYTTPVTSGKEGGRDDHALTLNGLYVGTPSYLSPEQIRRETVDPRCDLFSFGLVLYEMATGRRAFPGKTASDIRTAVLNMPAVAAREIAPEVPTELETIIGRCLEKDRGRRYQSASEVRSDLERARQKWTDAKVVAPRAVDSSAGKFRGKRLIAFLAAASVLVIAGLVASAYHNRARAARLGEKDTIVLADFSNSTGDTVFDGTLKQGLSIALSQSPYLNIVSDRKVHSTLRLMTRPIDGPVTGEVAREVCQRVQSKAFVAGAIAALGSEYVIGLKAENCENGEILAQEQVTAKDKEDVISALGTAAAHLRTGLGESIASVQKEDVPLREATTSSLEALKEFTDGGEAENKQGPDAAIAHYLRAIALDPLFARAYSSLSAKYYDAGESTLAAKYASKAYELRYRGTEVEQFLIAANYHGFTTGNLEKAAAAYVRIAELRPHSPMPHSNLGYIEGQLGQNDKVLQQELLALSMGPNSEQFTNLVSAYLALGRLQEAKATVAKAEAQGLNLPINHNNLYLIAFLEHDSAAMNREAAFAVGKPEIEAALYYSEFCTTSYYGQVQKARDLLKRANASAMAQNDKEAASSYRADGAVHEALYGNAAEARRILRGIPISASGQDVQAAAGFAYGFAGDRARAQALVDTLAKRYPENTIVQLNYLPTIRAEIALIANKPEDAIAALNAARPVELGQPAQVLYLNMYPTFVRGEAYLAAHNGAAAASEFQKILDNPGMSLNEPIALLAHLGVARAYGLKGDDAKARAEYEGFLKLWKDADPDLPILGQAKLEYSKLETRQ